MNLDLDNSQAFWDAVAADFYGRHAFSSAQRHCAEPPPQSALFAAVVECCRRHLLGEWGVELDWQQDAMPAADAQTLYPTSEDGSFAGYQRRMAALGVRFRLVVHDPQRVNHLLWRWGSLFLQPLFQRRGMNKLGVATRVTISNRTGEGAGVGFAPECSIHLPLIGELQHLLWPAEYLQTHPALKGSTDYQAHLDRAECLATPEQGFSCIPKKYWYATLFRAPFNVSLTLALQEYADITPYIINTLICPPLNEHREASDHFEYAGMPDGRLHHVSLPIDIDNLQASAEQPPASLLASFAAIHHPLRPEQMSAFWMRLLSANGFNVCPEALPTDQCQTATAHSVIQLAAQFPLRWRKTMDNALSIAANGHLVTIHTRHDYAPMLQMLNQGTTVALDEAASQLKRDELALFYDLINQLAAVQAVTIITPS